MNKISKSFYNFCDGIVSIIRLTVVLGGGLVFMLTMAVLVAKVFMYAWS